MSTTSSFRRHLGGGSTVAPRRYGSSVPRVSSFYGIAIYMYVAGEHPPPHFHAIYGEYEAQVSFDGKMLNGRLPPRAANLVSQWARLHRKELDANWQRAMAHESLASIEPLP